MNMQQLQSAQASIPLPVVAGANAKTLPRVLYVLNLNATDKFGSLEEQIVFLHEAFHEEGSRFLPLFACPAEPNTANGLSARGLEAHCLDLRRFHWNSLFAMRALINSQGIEIIHWHFTEPVANPYVWWLTLLNPAVRHFYTDHISRPAQPPYTPLTGWKKTLKRLLLKRYSQTWCVSQFVQNCLTEQGTWSNVHVCPHFINTDRFTPNAGVRAAMRHKYDAEDRFVVTVIAQLIPEKGIDVMLRAMTELPEYAVLWLVGTGSHDEALQALSHELGVDHRVRFLGLQKQVEPFLQATDCLVLPSRWKEAAGLVLLEAQATGVPVVASRIGGIPEYVDDERTGFLFTPENAQELAGHLNVLCHAPDLCRRMGQQARARAVQMFSPASQLPVWLNFYRGNRGTRQGELTAHDVNSELASICVANAGQEAA